MTTISRSEQPALDELILKNWMTDSPSTAVLTWYYEGYMNIDYIHQQFVKSWLWNYPSNTSDVVLGPHTDFDTPPPWNPTLRDIENRLMEDNMDGKLIQVLQYRGEFSIEHLDLPLLPQHIVYIQSLCNEFEALHGRVEVTDTYEGDAETAFDVDSDVDTQSPLEPMSPETIRIINLQPLTVRDIIDHGDSSDTNYNTLCSDGVHILDRIMDTATRQLKEGDYLQLCNLFRDLHT